MLCAQALRGSIYLASRRSFKISVAFWSLCHVKLLSAGIGLAARTRRHADLSSTICLIKFGERMVGHARNLDPSEPSAKAGWPIGRDKRLPSQGYRRVSGG